MKAIKKRMCGVNLAQSRRILGDGAFQGRRWGVLDLNGWNDVSPPFDEFPRQTRPRRIKIGAAPLAMRAGKGLLLELQHDVLGLSLGAL